MFSIIYVKDEIYNHKVKLIIKSDVDLDKLFTGEEGKGSEEVFMAKRCLSRLMEIQTQSYLKLAHLSESNNSF
jgi:predicted ATPase